MLAKERGSDMLVLATRQVHLLQVGNTHLEIIAEVTLMESV